MTPAGSSKCQESITLLLTAATQRSQSSTPMLLKPQMLPTLIHAFMQVCILFLSSSVILSLNYPPPPITTASHHTLYKLSPAI